MTTFTAYNRNSGTELGRGLDIVAAAQEILGYDSHTYELRREGSLFYLFISRGSAAGYSGTQGLTKAWSRNRLICSAATSKADAWLDIGAQVIRAGWDSAVEVMTDADYDAMLAEIARDAD